VETLILIFLFAAGITFAINLGYRFLANQGDARSVKARINELNSKMREEQKKGNKAEVSRLLGAAGGAVGPGGHHRDRNQRGVIGGVHAASLPRRTPRVQLPAHHHGWVIRRRER